jgi:ribosomal protein S14
VALSVECWGGKRIIRFCFPRLTALRTCRLDLIVCSSSSKDKDLRLPPIANRHHVSIPCSKARYRLLRQDPKYSRPHQAQGVCRKRARTVCASGRRIEHAITDSNFTYSQALRYIIRNTTLPQRVRAQAQLQLSQMHCYTRFTQVKNRCIMGGKGRGVFSDFRLGRVRHMCTWGNCDANTAAVSISY